MVTKSDKEVEMYPKNTEHRFEAPVYMTVPDGIAPGPGHSGSNEQEEQVF